MGQLYAANSWHEDDFDPANVSAAEWTAIYLSGGWCEQGSGPGSTIENNTELITWLNNFITDNSATSMIDIGCGDLQWVPQVLNDITSYTGVDCVPSVNTVNVQNHPTYTFLTRDIMTSEFATLTYVDNAPIVELTEPVKSSSYDILLCKDLLQHMVSHHISVINIIEKINCDHKIIIVPRHMEHRFTTKLIAAGYSLSQYYDAAEKKSIYVKTT
jgi:hypothetical protein